MQLLRRLCRDKCFALALLAGPVFWWINHYFELTRSEAELSLALLFSLVVLYPVLEELSFRGFLQGALLRTEAGRYSVFHISVANALTSVLFVGFHLLSQSLLWALAVLLPSLLFGVLRERHKSTLPCIILHCFYNLGFFLSR